MGLYVIASVTHINIINIATEKKPIIMGFFNCNNALDICVHVLSFAGHTYNAFAAVASEILMGSFGAKDISNPTIINMAISATIVNNIVFFIS